MSAAINESRLQAWLDRTPKNATALELRWDGMNGPQCVQRWERAELERQAAALIAECALDHCDDLMSRARYEVVWVDEHNKTLATKAFRLDSTPANDNAKADADWEKPNEEANGNGLTHMFMRHVETDRRMHNIAEANLLKFYRDALADARSEITELRNENRDLRKRARTAEAKAEGETDVESEARAAAYEKLTHAVTTYLIPLAAEHLSGKQH